MSLDESYPRIQPTTARKAGDLLTVTVVRQFPALANGFEMDYPPLRVNAVDTSLDETSGLQEGADREAAVADVEGPGENLEQQRRHEQEIVPAHQNDLNIRSASEEPFQAAGGVDSAKPAAEDQNAFHRC
jgi:hypothetical protein